MIGTIIAGSLGALGLGAGIWNSHQQNKISQQNLDLQKENLEYQKALQQQLFEREDSSYERTKQDMLNAGFSPLAMQGLNSAGSSVSTSAPQQNLDIGATLSSILGVASQAQSLAQVQSGIARTDAETKFINAQAENQNIKNAFTLSNERVDLDTKLENYSRLSRENAYDNMTGVSSQMPDIIKSLLYSSFGNTMGTHYSQTKFDSNSNSWVSDNNGISPTSHNDSFGFEENNSLKNYNYSQNIDFWTSLLRGFF